MSTQLKNKVVVITGGAGDIGSEIANRYLQEGATVTILLDVNENTGFETVKSLNSRYGAHKAVFYKCDITKDKEAVTKVIYDTYKYVDVLVNSAGFLNELMIKKTIDINVTALLEWSIKYWELMRKDKGGKGGTIINLASIYGFRVDQFGPFYQASKFAVMGFTKSLGHIYNFNRSGVRVMAICPGFTETKMTRDVKVWDSEGLGKDLEIFLQKQAWQKVDSVGKAAVEIFENADSGTAWLIEGGKPIVLVP